MINKFQYIMIIFIFLAIYANGANAQMNKKNIMIDLDGVLDNHTKYTEEIPEIKAGAKEFVKNYQKIMN